MKLKIRKRRGDAHITQGTPKVPHFKTIVADPPWMERGGGKIRRGADKHYPLLTTPQIIQTMATSGYWRPHPDGCHMYLWVTNNFLKDGIFVMEALGFRYITNRVWVKDRFGIGYYFRGQHEIVLFGTSLSGKAIPPKVKNMPSIFYADRTKHSQKPSQFYNDVELISQGPYLEMFARCPREGWTTWGNEV